MERLSKDLAQALPHESKPANMTTSKRCKCGAAIEPKVVKIFDRTRDITPEKCDECREYEQAQAAKQSQEEMCLLSMQMRRQRLQEGLDAAGFSPKEKRYRFATFKAATPELKAAKAAAMQYARDPKGVILFTATRGAGKTHLASAIGKVMVARGKKVRFIKTVKLMLAIWATFKSSSTKTAKDLVDELLACDCLILDDLGIEKPSEFTFEVLYTIIDDFYRFEKSLVITSNYSMEALDERIGEIITSRLSEICTLVDYEADDWRLNHG